MQRFFCKKKTLAARRESPAVVSFVYGSGPCSDANRRLRAPVVRPAPVRGWRHGSDASAGDFCFWCGKSRAKSPSKQANTIEILPQIPRRPTLAAREASPAATATPCTRNSGTEAGGGGGAGAAQSGGAAGAEGQGGGAEAEAHRGAAAASKQKRKARGELRRRPACLR